MNIAILTLPLHTNIGGILQSHALLSFLKKNGHEVMLINRGFNKGRVSLGSFLDKFLFQPIVSYRINKFVKKHIRPKTKKIHASKNLGFINELDIDTVIVGSDQVWRFDYIKDMYKDYFLEFIKNKKIKKMSYAASFGNQEWNSPDNITNEIKELLQDFTAISVRENTGVSMCKEIFGISNVTHVLDPTLLLEKNDYLNLIEHKKIKKNNGILTYFLDFNDSKKQITKFVSAELEMDVFSVNVERVFDKNEIFRLHKCIYPSVENWISGFNDCDFVITDSFHGMVFALIFEKPFITIGNEGRGIDRFISILDMIGMTRRLIFNFETISKELIHEPIDFKSIKKDLSKFRKISTEYLLENIKS